MRAKKSNKSYVIEPREQNLFQAQGYDIYDDEGNLIVYGAGKTVSANKYLELQKENEELKAQIKSLEGAEKKSKKEVK